MPRSSIVSLFGQHSYGDRLIDVVDGDLIMVYFGYQGDPNGLIFITVDEALDWIDSTGWSESDRWRFFYGWLQKLILEGYFGPWLLGISMYTIIIKANIKKFVKGIFK